MYLRPRFPAAMVPPLRSPILTSYCTLRIPPDVIECRAVERQESRNWGGLLHL